jgi:hypothetical protein
MPDIEVPRTRARVEEAIGTASSALQTAARVGSKVAGALAVLSAAAAAIAWSVLFAVRLDEGAAWIVGGLVALVLLLVPAGALLYLRRTLRWIPTVPSALTGALRSTATSVSPSELVRRAEAIRAAKGRTRQLVGAARLIQWLREQRSLTLGTEVVVRLVRVPPATMIGLTGTAIVILCIPLFALISVLLALA